LIAQSAQSAPKRSWRSKAGTFIIACVGNDNDLREVVPEDAGVCFLLAASQVIHAEAIARGAGGWM
jgi:hypothetical protein